MQDTDLLLPDDEDTFAERLRAKAELRAARDVPYWRERYVCQFPKLAEHVTMLNRVARSLFGDRAGVAFTIEEPHPSVARGYLRVHTGVYAPRKHLWTLNHDKLDWPDEFLAFTKSPKSEAEEDGNRRFMLHLQFEVERAFNRIDLCSDSHR